MLPPWEKQSVHYTQPSHNTTRRIPSGYENIGPSSYEVIKEYINDSPRQYWRKGDIVKFDDGFLSKYLHGWKDWFLTKADQKKEWLKDPRIPVYSRDQLAVIIGRYRVVKMKYRNFADYGIVLMMISGSKIGHSRSYYVHRPFVKKTKFPNQPQFKYMQKIIPCEILEILSDSYEDTNEGRNLLVSKLYYNLNKKG